MPFRTFGLFAAGAVITGAFLPWAKVSSIFGTFTKDGIDGDGVLTLAGGAIVGVLFLAGKRGSYVAAAVFAGLVAAIGLYDWLDLQRLSGDALNEGGVAVSAGVGLYLTILGAGAALVAALVAQAQAASAATDRSRVAGASVGATPPPGWHPDPFRVAALRYWDGAQWTGHTADRVAGTLPPPPLGGT